MLAFVRQLPKTVTKGVSAIAHAGETIDIARAARQKSEYAEALRRLVDEVEVLPADECHPDCLFVEDTAVFARGTAVVTRPGHPSRQGEEGAIRDALERIRITGGRGGDALNWSRLRVVSMQDMDPDATCDGGDVLFTGEHMFVGVSERTNAAGVAALAAAFGPSLPVIPVKVAGALHLKTTVTLLRPGMLVFADNHAGREVMERINSVLAGSLYKAVGVPDQLSANVVSVVDAGGRWRGTIVQGGGRCPHSLGLIREAFSPQEQGQVLEVEFDEMSKIDGALTCCSLLVHA